MICDLEYTFPTLPEDYAYELLNSLGVSYRDFSKVSNLRNKVYGVALENKETVLNYCMRQYIWSYLASFTAEVIDIVGYKLDTFYDKITVPIDFDSGYLIPIPYAGISKLNVKRGFSLVSSPTVNYIIKPNANVVLISGVYYVEVEKSLAPNYQEVIFRDTDGFIYPINTSESVRISGDLWQIPIGNSTKQFQYGTTIDVYHKSMCYIDVTPPATQNGDLVVCYQNTKQIIKPLKTETLSNGDIRFWFFNYEMLKPEFTTDDRVSLLEDVVNFLRFFDTLDVYDMYDETANFVLYDETGTDVTSNFTVDIKIFSSEPSFVYVTHNISESDYSKYQLEFYYKTDVNSLPVDAKNSIMNLIYGVICRVAAEIPVQTCYGSNTDSIFESIGFLAKMQSTETQNASKYIRTTIGAEIVEYLYGTLVGHATFNKVLEQARRIKHTIMLNYVTSERRVF